MPSARSADFQRVARKIGFSLVRQKGSHQIWQHPDERVVTISVHPTRDIGPPLFYEMLDELGIDQDTFDHLR